MSRRGGEWVRYLPALGGIGLGVFMIGHQLAKDFPRPSAVQARETPPGLVVPQPDYGQTSNEDLLRFPAGVLGWESLLRQTASDRGVSVVDLATIMTIESGGVMTVPGGAGEKCAMQIMFEYHGHRIPEPYPKTPESLLIPEVCVWVAADILADYQTAYPHNPAVWYAAYNGGPKAAQWFNGEISRDDYITWMNAHDHDGTRKASDVEYYVGSAMSWRGQ